MLKWGTPRWPTDEAQYEGLRHSTIYREREGGDKTPLCKEGRNRTSQDPKQILEIYW